MFRRVILILVAMGLMAACCSIAAANEGTEEAVTETIALKNSPPLYLMMILGFCSEDEYLSGMDISCTYSDKLGAAERQIQGQDATPCSVPVSFLLPEGVKSVASVSSERSLRVVGTATGLKSFRKIIAMLDVPRKQVQIKTEAYQVKPGSVNVLVSGQQPEGKKPEPNALGVAFASSAALDELKTRLTNEGAQLHSSPIITTLNNEAAYISISSMIPLSVGAAESGDAKKFIEVASEISVRPRVNGDGTITVSFKAVIPRDDRSDLENAQQSKSTLATNFRVKSGESAVLYELAKESEGWLLLIVTPTVVPDAPVPSTGVGMIN